MGLRYPYTLRIQLFLVQLFCLQLLGQNTSLDADCRLRLTQFSNATWPEEVTLVLTGNYDQGFHLNGVRVKVFTPPKLHHRGYQNGLLLQYKIKGDPRLLKILGALKSEEKYYEKNLRGSLIGSEADGPSVTRAGRIQLPDGNIGYYIEMTELFYGEPSFTFKGVVVVPKEPIEAQRLIEGPPESRPTRLMARLLVKAYSKMIVPNEDVDWIFSNGKARFLDTSHWEWWEDKPVEGKFAAGLNTVIERLGVHDKKLVKIFVLDFIDELRAFTDMDPLAKRKLLLTSTLARSENLYLWQLFPATLISPKGSSFLTNAEGLLRLYENPELFAP